MKSYADTFTQHLKPRTDKQNTYFKENAARCMKHQRQLMVLSGDLMCVSSLEEYDRALNEIAQWARQTISTYKPLEPIDMERAGGSHKFL